MVIAAAEYERMRSWFIHMLPKVFGTDLGSPENHPVAFLDRTVASSRANARSGLGMAIGDMVEVTSNWSAADVERCDSELSQSGLMALTEMQARFSKVVQRVVRRNRIQTDEEFYAIRSAVELNGANGEVLWRLLDAYKAGGASDRSL